MNSGETQLTWSDDEWIVVNPDGTMVTLRGLGDTDKVCNNVMCDISTGTGNRLVSSPGLLLSYGPAV